MNNFLKHNLEMPLTGGSSSGGGADTTESSAKTGDVLITARSDTSNTHLPIDESVDITYDKTQEPEVYEILKEPQDNALLYDVNDSMYNDNANPINFATPYYDNYRSIYFFNGKWIRTIGIADYIVFQVSQTFDFSILNEYPVYSSHQSILYCPEQNCIFYWDSYYLKRLDIVDADDLVDYADVNYGGNGLKTPISLFYFNSFFSNELELSSKPDDPDCFLCLNQNTDDAIAYARLSDCLSSTVTFNFLSKTDVTNDGYNVYIELFMSGNKVFFYDDVSRIVYSKNIDTNTYSIELDFSSSTSTYIGFSTRRNIKDGCLMFQDDYGTYVINKYKDENSFKLLNRINPNLNNQESVQKYYAKSNVIISYLPDSTGLNLATNASQIYLVSYDDGLNWNQFFYNPFRTNWLFRQPEPGEVESARAFNDFIFYVCGAGVGFVSGYTKHFFLIEFQEAGFSDLFTVNSWYLNGQLKGHIKR